MSLRNIKIHPESMESNICTAKKGKTKIPKALREQVWLRHMGQVFEGKCPTSWCQNRITVFNFESGHDIPESKGGSTTIENLIPLCGKCNKSMSNQYMFKEWCLKYSNINLPRKKLKGILRFFSCFYKTSTS
jgi:5-methylcytosine-specific restriction endonuclease McrA